METTEFVIIVAGIVAAVAVLLMAWYQKKRFDAALFISQFDEMRMAAEMARDFVLAAEQLWETGQIPKEDRYEVVWLQMQKWFPNIDEDTLEVLIESAVKGLKILEPKVETIIFGPPDGSNEVDSIGDNEGTP